MDSETALNLPENAEVFFLEVKETSGSYSIKILEGKIRKCSNYRYCMHCNPYSAGYVNHVVCNGPEGGTNIRYMHAPNLFIDYDEALKASEAGTKLRILKAKDNIATYKRAVNKLVTSLRLKSKALKKITEEIMDRE